jgi:hypothetical protein
MKVTNQSLVSRHFTISGKARCTPKTGGWFVPGLNVAGKKNSYLCRKSVVQRFIQSL